MPDPEYLNFVGKFSDVRMGIKPRKAPIPRRTITHCRTEAVVMCLSRTAKANGYERSVVRPIVKYASVLRLKKSANGPLMKTPRTSAILLRNIMVAIVAKGMPAKRMKEIT